MWARKPLHYGIAVIILAWPHSAPADDFDQDFSLRFPAAFSRFSAYPSVVGLGNAQAASDSPSSINPASAAWPHPSRPYDDSISGMFSMLGFAQGADVYVAGEVVVLDTGANGVFEPFAAQLRGNHEQTSAGLGFDFDADYYQVQWGKMFGEDWALGAGVNYTSSAIEFDISGLDLVRTRSDTYGLRLGALHRAAEKLRLGLVLDYALTPMWMEQFDALGLGIGTLRSEDHTHRILARPGLVWQYAQRGNLYLDYQGGAFWNDTGTLWVHRFPVGIDYWLVPRFLIGRVGANVDTRGNTAFTTGAGIQLGPRAIINFAYQYGMFPEIRQDFGAAQTFALSAAIGF